jgi:HEAT repeat protein
VLVEWGEKDITLQLLSILGEEYAAEYSFIRSKMADLLANIGDSTIANELLEFLHDEQVKSHIRARAADALSALELDGLLPEIRAMVVNENIDAMVRGRAAHCLIQADNGVTWLTELLQREDIREEVYLALYSAARQSGIRIFGGTGEGYEVLPLQTNRAGVRSP